MAENYKIELGINFTGDKELNNIKKQLTNLTDNTHRIKIDVDNSRLLKQIEHAKRELKELNSTKGNQPSLTVNTISLEQSLNRVADVIDEVKKSLGTIDDKSGMQSLVSSVNQIATALGKVEGEADSLVKSLSALSNKNFNINLGIDMGEKKLNTIGYGRAARKSVIPELEAQIEALENLYGGKQAAISKLAQNKDVGFDIFTDFGDFNSDSAIKKMEAMEKYINSLKKLASTNNVDLSGFNKIHKDASELINNITGVENAADKAEDSMKKLKSVFGGGSSDLNLEGLSTQLKPITEGLAEIKNAVDGLSKIDSLNNLTQTFDRLSGVLEELSSSFMSVQKYFDSLNNSSNGLDNSITTASQSLKNNADILEKFKNSLLNIGMGTEEIDRIADRIQNLGIQIETLDQKRTRAAAKGKGKNKGTNTLSVDISGTDKDGNIVKFTEQYNVATGRLVKSIEDVSTAQKRAGTSSNTFVKQQKNAVSDLTNTINQLNRAAIDPNAGKPIKNDTHLNSLSNQYRLVTEAIERMGNASNDNDFQEERNNVKALITEYKSLTREYRNAETSATSFRSKDIDTIKSTNASDLDVLIQKMKDAGVYTDGFKNGAENLRKILNNATDTSGINEFLNGFDKLEAGYKRAAQYAKSSEKAATYGKRAQGLVESIKNIQRISPEINNFEVDVNGAKVSVQSLLDTLSQVKTKSDFDSANEDLKVFKKSAEAAGIAIRETAKEANSNFDKLKSLAKEMGKVDIELAKVDNVDDFNSLKRLANDLEAEYKDLYSTIGKNLNAEQLRELDQIFANTTGAVRELNSEMSKSSETSELTSGLDRLKSIAKEINSLKLNIFKFEDADNIEQATNRLNELENEATELRLTLQQKFNIQSFDEIDNIAKQGEQALNDLIAKAEETKAKLAKSIKLDIELGNVDNEMDTMRVKFDNLSDANTELRKSLEQVENAYKELNLAAKTNSGDEIVDRENLIQAEKEYAAALEKTNNLIKQQARIDKTNNDAIKLQDNREKFQAKIDTWMAKNSAATKQFGTHLLDLRAKAEKADQVQLNHLESELYKVDKAADKAGLKMMSLGDRIKSKAKEYMAYLSVAEVFMWVEQAARAMFDTVLEIDTAMTGLYRVTDLTASQYDALFDNMISSAKEYGATLNDIINATTDWVRAGFDADTSLGLAEVTTMYQHISDLDYDTAAENLITAYNGFKDELNTAFGGDTVGAVEYIADIFNELDNNFAVTSAGLGEALTRSASALDLAGNSIQETAGMVTGIVEVTQDPEKAGKMYARTYSNVWCNYKVA